MSSRKFDHEQPNPQKMSGIGTPAGKATLQKYAQVTKRIKLWDDIDDLDLRMCLIFYVDKDGSVQTRLKGSYMPELVKAIMDDFIKAQHSP